MNLICITLAFSAAYPFILASNYVEPFDQHPFCLLPVSAVPIMAVLVVGLYGCVQVRYFIEWPFLRGKIFRLC